jgi:hypothetical protein
MSSISEIDGAEPRGTPKLLLLLVLRAICRGRLYSSIVNNALLSPASFHLSLMNLERILWELGFPLTIQTPLGSQVQKSYFH